ncbi:hypothetical protein R1flu_015974 [Riccia fluitans]|uniref:Uncharacterized protein n=1 Tax=Riccia fluitans TaxID=41844 RepID=A0ABD1YKP6_9MARC
MWPGKPRDDRAALDVAGQARWWSGSREHKGAGWDVGRARQHKTAWAAGPGRDRLIPCGQTRPCHHGASNRKMRLDSYAKPADAA